MITISPRARDIGVRAHRTWSELAYAQRRMFEIRAGLPPAERRLSGVAPAEPHAGGAVEELERLYRIDSE